MSGLRVLVVEDDPLVAMLIEDAVMLSGALVAQIATNVHDAMAAATRDDFDVALLDLNLHGQRANAVPVVLAARGKPFAFVTGYGDAGVLKSFERAPVVHKPFGSREIGAVLARLAEQISPPEVQ